MDLLPALLVEASPLAPPPPLLAVFLLATHTESHRLESSQEDLLLPLPLAVSPLDLLEASQPETLTVLLRPASSLVAATATLVAS